MATKRPVRVMTVEDLPLAKPTNADVATLLRARTKDLTGDELGVFTANTRPTDADVDRIIDLAYAEVTGRVGLFVADPCAQSATALVAIRAAAWVELSYWPEQIRSDRSVYAELIERWTEGLAGCIACVEGNMAGADDASTMAGYRFGSLDVHGWTASPFYGAPVVPLDPVPLPPPDPAP